MADGDANQMQDGVEVVLNPDPDAPLGFVLNDHTPLPDRPADSATVDTWVDYCVALGASKDILRGGTEHVDGMEADGQTVRMVTSEKMTKADLQDLATRLGG